jgi:nitrate reductase assembly molybdenum cofactor insertion protein NarJ
MNIPLDQQSQKLLAQAAAWRLASLLLERPRAHWRSEIEALSSEVGDKKLLACAKSAAQATEESYHRTFGPGGSVSLREVSYCGFEDPGQLMAKLEAFYRAFSFHPKREEPVDHVSVEAGFVGYLLLKEAYARIRGGLEGAEITANARVRFAAEHLARCARAMADRQRDLPCYLRGVFSWLALQCRSRATSAHYSISA